MSEPDRIVSALVAVGFSLNESRAYAALLVESPATGYEVGVRAQIPRSAVYGVLRRLVKAGAARSIAGSPERFAPAPAEDLLVLLRKRFETSTEQLEEAIRDLDVAPKAPDAFTVHGYARILEEAERLVRGAQHRLVISGWPREIEQLSPELKRAAKRKVYAVVFSHAELPPLPVETFSYGLPERGLEEFWKHRLVVVADDRRSLIGATEMNDGDNAVVSETPAIAEIATSQVALDITLLSQRQQRDVGDVMARMLGDRVGRLDTLLARPDARPRAKAAR
ncbi:MAG: TrmB family transcriptional regulator [Labilithrix sp.]|nr:TrmB family transcriptional regulator [Labilithrix sp.]MCW5810452.1 TrmB family transcriptional regulator [Labilithrix sp.]